MENPTEKQECSGLTVPEISNEIKKVDDDTYTYDGIKVPPELDRFLFSDLKAEYAPLRGIANPISGNASFTRFMDLKEIKKYLGTYFPRSFAESYLIYKDILSFQHLALPDVNFPVASDDTVKILSFGCGTGGDIIGCIYALVHNRPNLKTIEITGIDGNEIALDTAKKIISFISTFSKVRIEFHPILLDVKILLDINSDRGITVDKLTSFDFVQTFKTAKELPQGSDCITIDDVYYRLTAALIPYIKSDGLFILLDLCDRYEPKKIHYPVYLNKQLSDFTTRNKKYSSLLPLPCAKAEAKYYVDCKDCFTEKYFYVSHSRRTKDISKVAFRVLGHTEFIEKVISKIPTARYFKNYKRMDDFCPYISSEKLSSTDQFDAFELASINRHHCANEQNR